MRPVQLTNPDNTLTRTLSFGRLQIRDHVTFVPEREVRYDIEAAAEVFARRQMHALIYYLQVEGYRGRKLDTHVLASVSPDGAAAGAPKPETKPEGKPDAATPTTP